MKTTEIQKKICKVVKLQSEFWTESNDLESPTHLCDIDECVGSLSLDDIITDDQSRELGDLLKSIYFFIRNIK